MNLWVWGDVLPTGGPRYLVHYHSGCALCDSGCALRCIPIMNNMCTASGVMPLWKKLLFVFIIGTHVFFSAPLTHVGPPLLGGVKRSVCDSSFGSRPKGLDRVGSPPMGWFTQSVNPPSEGPDGVNPENAPRRNPSAVWMAK